MDGGFHALALMLLVIAIGLDGRLLGRRAQFN
jgi:hypothetical protein